MDITQEAQNLIGQKESEQLEYKAVLPPSRILAQIISSFANTKGGFLILGVAETATSFKINGLSEDFYADAVLVRALELLTPRPNVHAQYIMYDGKKVFAIKVDKAKDLAYIEGKLYIRLGDTTQLENPIVKEFKAKGYSKIKQIHQQIDTYRKLGSDSKSKFIDHFQSVLNIMDDLGSMLYPVSPPTPTDNQEGKILMRILFSSCADNFEIYLSDLLFEIFLANPASLKNNQQVTVREVLDCSDIQEFITYWAKKKLEKLQRGSVKGFIADNDQIGDLNAIDDMQQKELEKILQIRHLYSHRNGIVDDKFLKFFIGLYNVNDEHRLSIEEALKLLGYIAETVDRLDKSAVLKYSLVTLD